MSYRLFGCAAGTMLALAVSVSAQNPPSQTPSTQPPTSPPSTRQSAAPDQKAAVTVEGCLVRETDVPGRKPNVAERAGVMEDYILTNAKVVKGTPPRSSAAQAKPAEPTGTSGATADMFDVKGIEGDRLKEFVGKRVQIDGKFEDLERSPAAKPAEDLVNIEGTAIRAAAGTCPAK